MTYQKNMTKWKYILPGIFGAIYALLTIALFFTEFKIKINWELIPLTIAICHIISSIKIVREQEIAVLIFFGVILEEWKSGFHFALWPFFYTRKETKNSVQVDFGTLDERDTKNTELIRRSEESEKSQSWFVMREPVRINWGDIKSLGTEEEKKQYDQDPLASAITTDPHLYFRLRISNLGHLIERVGGLEEAIERIKDTCVRVLTQEAGKTFVSKARKEMSELSAKLKEAVEDLAGDPEAVKRVLMKKSKLAETEEQITNRSWGVDIEDVAIKDIGLPYDTNKALAERTAKITAADASAKALTRQSESEKIAAANAAEAKCNTLTKEGEGEAAKIKAIANAIKEGGKGATLPLKIEALKEGLKYGKTTILPMDMSLLTHIVSVAEAIKTSGTKKPED